MGPPKGPLPAKGYFGGLQVANFVSAPNCTVIALDVANGRVLCTGAVIRLPRFEVNAEWDSYRSQLLFMSLLRALTTLLDVSISISEMTRSYRQKSLNVYSHT